MHDPVQQSLQKAAFGLDGEAPPTRDFGPVVVQVRDVCKSFRMPHGRVLRALRGVSFDVLEGEFFGVVGRNGSGKSTLLKVLSSIYGADSGSVRVAGRLAPFIELGVGFDMELTARENVSLNGVMMGLSRREAASRLGAVLEFAELSEFVDLKLKNYSSGMLVRLAFAVMVEADADVMLIDEVLAVGDAAFAQKCMDVFREKRSAGKTLVLVTHDMATVQGFCDRALVLHDGELQYIGNPEEAILQYYRLNFGERASGPAGGDAEVRIVDAWLENEEGARIDQVERAERLHFHAVVEAGRELRKPAFSFTVVNVDGAPVFGFGTDRSDEPDPRMAAGTRVHIAATMDNPLLPSRYSVDCEVIDAVSPGEPALRSQHVLDLLVMGTDPVPGMVSVTADLSVAVERQA